MAKRKKLLILTLILITATFLRSYNLMFDAPYFFNPDEKNMAIAITRFRLPSKLKDIPLCLSSEFYPSILNLTNKKQNQLTDSRQLTADNCSLNPHFFAYGQFPLYLAYTSDQAAKIVLKLFINSLPASIAQPTTNNQQPTTNLSSAIFWLRFWSAFSSIFTVLLVYLITKEIFDNHLNKFSILNFQFSILAALSAAFVPGLIQSAHFGTTESLLTFFFTASIYLAIKYVSRQNSIFNSQFSILNSLVIGLSLGSKLTGLFFFIPPLTALLIQMIRIINRRARKQIIVSLLHCFIVSLLIAFGTAFFAIVSSPYNLIEFADFKSAVFGYETDVATGRFEAFYTKQFVDTTPILFQIEKIFPHALGWPIFVLGSIGLLLINLKLFLTFFLAMWRKVESGKWKVENSIFSTLNSQLSILNFSFLIYLLPNSFLFTKWTRFVTPILPFFTIFAVVAVKQFYQVLESLIVKSQKSKVKSQNYNVKSKILHFNLPFYVLVFAFCILAILPGIAFMSIYTQKDSRVQSSNFIYENLPKGSYVLSETANVVDIPLGMKDNKNVSDYNYTVISFDFYHLDANPKLYVELLNHLVKADYIFVPSRRIFANYTRLPQKYPLVSKYYDLLFSGSLGFEKIAEISSYPSINIPLYPKPYTLIFPDEQAEESFTVFDHPVIRIYKKDKQFTKKEYREMFER